MVRLNSLVPKLLFAFFALLPSFYNSGNWTRETEDTCSRLRLSSWKSPKHKSLTPRRALLKTLKWPGGGRVGTNWEGRRRFMLLWMPTAQSAVLSPRPSSTPAAWMALPQPSGCLINGIHLWALYLIIAIGTESSHWSYCPSAFWELIITCSLAPGMYRRGHPRHWNCVAWVESVPSHFGSKVELNMAGGQEASGPVPASRH